MLFVPVKDISFLLTLVSFGDSYATSTPSIKCNQTERIKPKSMTTNDC